MKFEFVKPQGCRAEAIGHLVAVDSAYDRGNVTIVCGDRRFDLPTSKDHARAIEYALHSRHIDKLRSLVAEVVCGFCVGCPNRTAAVPDLPE